MPSFVADLDFSKASSEGYATYDGPLQSVDGLLQLLESTGCSCSSAKQARKANTTRREGSGGPEESFPYHWTKLQKPGNKAKSTFN